MLIVVEEAGLKQKEPHKFLGMKLDRSRRNEIKINGRIANFIV